MSALYWFINLCLITLAAGTTVWIGGAEPQQMFQQPKEIEDVSNDQTKATIDDNRTDDAGLALDQHMDTLWQRTLFRPERTEAVSTEPKEPKDDEPEKPKRKRVEMELIGIGQIGDKSAAVIRVKKKRRGNKDKSDLKKNVYRLDDSVRDTGFKVSKISLNGVTLSRGDDTRELTLTKSDAASERRRKEAVQAEKEKDKERKKRREEKKDKEEKEKPEPPPPPPAPGGPDSDAEKESTSKTEKPKQASGGEKDQEEDLTRKERIKRALEARRRILEKRRKARQNEGE